MNVTAIDIEISKIFPSTAVRTPVIAVIEHNYEQNGEIAIPAGSKDQKIKGFRTRQSGVRVFLQIMAARRGLAFSFNSDLSFQEMIARPIPMGPWKWHERGSAWYDNLASAREKCPSGKIELHLMESGVNEMGMQVFAGGAREPRQFAVSMALIPDHSMDANYDREWEGLQSAFLETLLPSLGARDLQVSDSIDA